ncbi:hypothetical protein [Shewanella sp. 38A_GOM-205m]|uniref:hypothetical protein n=1 Tax=Shewanella sp. 38A_GOM-205m TaxID=1380363 RepID=UPI0012DE135E|nr:hypothetical protein [Shewanella sp. 38A_GOM-205m]
MGNTHPDAGDRKRKQIPQEQPPRNNKAKKPIEDHANTDKDRAIINETCIHTRLPTKQTKAENSKTHKQTQHAKENITLPKIFQPKHHQSKLPHPQTPKANLPKGEERSRPHQRNKDVKKHIRPPATNLQKQSEAPAQRKEPNETNGHPQNINNYPRAPANGKHRNLPTQPSKNPNVILKPHRQHKMSNQQTPNHPQTQTTHHSQNPTCKHTRTPQLPGKEAPKIQPRAKNKKAMKTDKATNQKDKHQKEQQNLNKTNKKQNKQRNPSHKTKAAHSHD